MPQDIRSFFTRDASTSATKDRQKKDLNTSKYFGEKPISKETRGENEGKKKKSDEIMIHDDSDEDIIAASPRNDKKSNKKISATDFFNQGGIHRAERKMSTKRKSGVLESGDSHDQEVEQPQETEKLERPSKKTKTESKTEKHEGPKKTRTESETEKHEKTPSKKTRTESKTEKHEIPKKTRTESKTEEHETPSKKSRTESMSEGTGTTNQADVLDSPSQNNNRNEIIKSPPGPIPTTSPAKLKDETKQAPHDDCKPEKVNKIPSEPSSEKKRSSYHAYKSRSGPSALGSKEIPEGQPNCLEGLTFVITGVQESIEREHLKSLLERLGAKVTTSISKKTSFLITGRDAGETKLNKAKHLGIKIIEEEDVFEMMRTKPGKESKYEIQARKAVETERKEAKKSAEVVEGNVSKSNEQTLWVDKYKPKTLKNIIGQQGEKSNAKKLLSWLRNWHSNVRSGKKPSFGNKWNDDGSGYRAALLSGPPGVGKTTTAHLVCKEAGFAFVELNASDARSKSTLDKVVAEMLHSCSLDKLLGKESGPATKTPTNCLVMDEVDGMAGNEDRGGMAELIGLIKKTHIPVICICNDRQSMKVRSLANHCFDLRFQRPRVEQIKSAMMSMTFKEGLKIPPPAINEIIIASNQDVRQVIHNLSMWSASDKTLTFDQIKAEVKDVEKDIKFGPFDVVRKVFSSSEGSGSINDKSDLFFHDYSLGPLFVQENYIHVQPAGANETVKKLHLLAQCADSIAEGDVISRTIRSSQSWSLLPLQAIAASVRPGEFMRGYIGQQINFPSWLGKYSTRNKNRRLLDEINQHMHLKVDTDHDSLNMDYRTYLKNAMFTPLLREDGSGVQETLDLLENYDLLKEDFEALIELSKWGNSSESGMQKVQSKTKAALTRKYNQSSRKLPYITGSLVKAKKSTVAEEFDEEGNVINKESQADDNSDDETIDIAALKPVKSKTTKAKSGSSGGKGKKTKGK